MGHRRHWNAVSFATASVSMLTRLYDYDLALLNDQKFRTNQICTIGGVLDAPIGNAWGLVADTSPIKVDRPLMSSARLSDHASTREESRLAVRFPTAATSTCQSGRTLWTSDVSIGREKGCKTTRRRKKSSPRARAGYRGSQKEGLPTFRMQIFQIGTK